MATADKEYVSSGGGFTVNGATVSPTVTFSLVTYTITFTESGLPSGTSWFVNLTDGQSNSSAGSTIGFLEPNGTYNYTVATADKEYAPTLAGGSFGVSGAPVSESVTFSLATYTVTFTETGLPSGTTWYVNGTAWGSLSATVADTLGTSVSVNLTNGTYSFTVASANRTWAPAYTSLFVVDGGPVAVPVTFTEVTYAVTFTESGLPSGTPWNVTIGSVTRNSTTSTIIFYEPNGTYSYTVATADKEYVSSGGGFTVNGATVSPTVTFSLVTYTITFTESGLPSGTTWYVNLTNGQSHSSTGKRIDFSEPNGTYRYTVATADKEYAPTLPGGSFEVTGTSVGDAVTFNLATFFVTFTETGLPSGTTWYVNGTAWGSLSATVAGTLGTAVSANLANGTYSFTVASANKTWAPAYTSPFVVNGGPVAVPVTFTEVTYAVTFTESGLPSGTSWYVNLTDGQSNSSAGSTIGFLEPNGTYNYTVATADKEYAPTLAGGSFGVSGAPVSESVTFSLVIFTVTFTERGLPSGTEWWVNVTGQPSQSSRTTAISVGLPNGTYVYVVATTDKSYQSSAGAFTVRGAVASESVTFSLVTYAVTFTETGLPSGTTWYVNGTAWGSLSATVADTLGTSVSVNLTNGTYSFTVASANRTWAPAYTSLFVVDGGPVAVPVTSTEVTYAVTFTESGLPSGTPWNVTIGSVTRNSTTSTIIFYEPNGTYSYTVATADREDASGGGLFRVDGTVVSEGLTFTVVQYTVTFTETGLPSGTTWYVNITGGQSHSSTGSTISFSEPNGTYVYTVGGVPDWTSQEETGTVAVHGAKVSMPTVAFTSTRSMSSATGWWVWAVDAIVIIVVVATALVVVMSRRKPPATPLRNSSTVPESGGSGSGPPGRGPSE